MVVLRDQMFPVDGSSLAYDFIRPAGDGPFPLVIFVHGGGWISGEKTDFRDEAVWLAPQGYACACIEYRLAPLYPFPVPVADCQAFVEFSRQNAKQLAIDPDNLTAIGNSAGGHLALMLGLCDNSFAEVGGAISRVNAVVDICGIADLYDPGDSNLPIAMSFLEQFMDGPYVGRENLWRQASPMSYVQDGQGRYLVIHGTDDDVVPVWQSRCIVESMAEHGIDAKYIELPGEGHSFSWSGWEQIRRAYVGFLSAR